MPHPLTTLFNQMPHGGGPTTCETPRGRAWVGLELKRSIIVFSIKFYYMATIVRAL